MNALYVMIPIALLIAVGALFTFLWSMKSGQYDDVEGPKYRMLFDEEDENRNKKNQKEIK